MVKGQMLEIEEREETAAFLRSFFVCAANRASLNHNRGQGQLKNNSTALVEELVYTAISLTASKHLILLYETQFTSKVADVLPETQESFTAII